MIFYLILNQKFKKVFTKELLIIKDAMEKLNINKKMIDINIYHYNLLMCNVYGIIKFCYEEISKINENNKDKEKKFYFRS